MIHYTLLPENEIKKLKKEYRTRLFIFVLFFMSFAVLVGVLSLLPAYIFSYTQEKDALIRFDELKKNRQNDTINQIKKDLAVSADVLNKLNLNKSSIIFSSIISKIISYKPSGVIIKSFDITPTGDTASSTINIIIQGKSSTRESLVLLKDKISSDPLVASVELPVSDLAKSKDISYSIKIVLNQGK